MFGAKLRQLRFSLREGRATLDYPFGPRPSEEGYRGRVVVDTARCVGCGGCAVVCPARCILITDVTPAWRIMRRYLDRCIHCGRCKAACAYGALDLVPEYELATPDRSDLLIEQKLFMGVCRRCGRCYVPAHPLDRGATGWCVDEPAVADAEAQVAWSGEG